MLGEALDGDAHTISDGAYSRFMRMRKWIVLTAGALWLLSTGLFDWRGFSSAVWVPSLSRDWVHFSFSAALLYQSVMVALVLLQLSEEYSGGLDKRMGGEAPKLAELRDALFDAQMRALDGQGGIRVKKVEPDSSSVATASAAMATLREPILEDPTARIVREAAERNQKVEAARLHLRRARRRLWRVRWPEMIIDAMRIGPTTLLMAYALFEHSLLWPIPPIEPGPA